MGYGISIVPETIRTNAGTSAGYTALGTPLLHSTRYLKFTNTTDVTLMVSWDGVHDHFVFPANSFDVIDVSTNKVKTDAAFVAQGTQFWVKRVSGAATTGAMYLSVLYGYGD